MQTSEKCSFVHRFFIKEKNQGPIEFRLTSSPFFVVVVVDCTCQITAARQRERENRTA